MFLLVLIPAAQAATMGLHGTVLNSSGDGASGDLRVLIYDHASDGSLLYNESFDDAVNDGAYAVMLGNGSEPLDLSFGTDYYLDMRVNGEDLDFDGAERRAFTSNVGAISSLQDVSIDNLAVGTNASFPELCLNDTCRTSWPVDTQRNVSGDYLSINSTTIGFSETKLNSTIDAHIPTDYDAGWVNDSANTTTSLNVIAQNNLSVNGTGFFGWLGTLSQKITGLFAQAVHADEVNVSGNLTLNGQAITDWADVNMSGTDTQKNASGPYLWNDTTTIHFDEVKLNETIDERIPADLDGGWANTSTVTNTSLDVLINGSLNVTENATIGEVLELVPSTNQPSCSAGSVIMYDNTSTVYPCYCNGTAWVRFDNNSATC